MPPKSHHLVSEDLSSSQMGAADSFRRLLNQGLCLEKDHSLWPAAGTSPEVIEKRAKMFRQNHALFCHRLQGTLSDAQEEARGRLLAELGDKVLPVPSALFMIILELVRLHLQELCAFDEDNGEYDDLIYRLEGLEEGIFFLEEILFDVSAGHQLLSILHRFQASTIWREDLQYTLQYKLAYTYWLCSAHMMTIGGPKTALPMWEPFSESEVAEAINRLEAFIAVSPEFMVIC